MGSIARKRAAAAVRTVSVPVLLLASLIAIAAVDWAVKALFLPVLLALPLLAAAVLARVRTAITLMFVADALAVVLGALNHEWLTPRHLVHLSVVVAAGFVAIAVAANLRSARKTAAGLSLLAEVGSAADATRSLEQFADRLTRLLVPRLADAVSIDRFHDGEAEWLAARATGPFGTHFERALLRRNALPPEWPVGSQAAARLGRSNVVEPIPEPVLRAVAANDEDYEALMPIKAAMFVPLIARGEAVGALSFLNGRFRGGFSEAEVRFAEQLAGRVSLGIENADLTQQLAETTQRLATILGGISEAVLVQEGTGQIVFANDAAARLMGRESADEIIAADPAELGADFVIADEHGVPIPDELLPARRVLDGEDTVEPLIVRRTRVDGEDVRWLRSVAAPLVMPDGERLAVSVVDDISDLKRAERAGRLLADAGNALAVAPDDPERALRALAELVVPDVADWCAVDLPGAGGEFEAVAIVHRDPAKVAVGRELRRVQPPRLDDPDAQAQVMRTGEPLVVSEVTPEQLDEVAHDERHRALLDAVGICSLMIVPMRTSARVLGTLTFVSSSPTRTFDDADVAFAEELGRRAAVAIEHARIYGERSHIAATLQHSLVPADPPDLPGWRIATLYRPAGDGIEAGGDFYDVVRTDRGWMAFVGDVCGKGAEAAALTALCRYTLRSAAKLGLAAHAALAHLNQALIDGDGLLLCTVVALEFDSAGKCAVANAGHPRALLVRDGEPMPVERAGPMLGIDADVDWPHEAFVLDPQDTFVLYTDGVLDAGGEDGERFGEARTESAVSGAGLTAEVRLHGLVSQIEAFQSGAQRDDAAALVLERVATRSARAVTARA